MNTSFFRYDIHQEAWYKGNCHIHSTASDGGKTFAELERMYAGAGYDFLFRTDHWVVSEVGGPSDGGTPASPLLWLDGTELDGRFTAKQDFLEMRAFEEDLYPADVQALTGKPPYGQPSTPPASPP